MKELLQQYVRDQAEIALNLVSETFPWFAEKADEARCVSKAIGHSCAGLADTKSLMRKTKKRIDAAKALLDVLQATWSRLAAGRGRSSVVGHVRPFGRGRSPRATL